ncbi:PEP-CTERM sorting domain-containing protein [Desulfococcaceae bacterium HSG9]|nr:PEP-CTERM sorting domain-containing protein [Desulfococcaceae bacterium HSG9]
MAIAKKLSVIITFCVLVLTPFSVGAIQLQTVGDPTTWSTAHIEFNGSHVYYAGEFELILGQGSDAFDTVGYCVELDEPISIGFYDAELKSVDFKDNGMDAAWLMNEYAYGLGKGPANAGINEIMNAKAALQLAIWETIHGADFTLLSDTADSIENLYRGYLNGLATAKSTGTYNTDFANNFSIAHQVDVQDLLIYNPDNSGAVPEPSTILLVGCGLIAFGLIRRRSNKKN